MFFSVQTFGCKVNSYETEVMIESCKKAGFIYTDVNCNCDIIIINTCCVTSESARKCKQAIRRYRKEDNDRIIIIVGCLSQVESPDSFPEADIIIGNKNKSKIADYINCFLKNKKQIVDITDNKKYSPFENMVALSSEHTRAFVKVQDGCNNFCSYCIIPFARGRECSKNIDVTIKEITNLVSAGFKEIVLTGIHLDSYGNDINTDLISLISAVDNIPGIERIRLGSLEPTFINNDNVFQLQNIKHLCPHFHLSLQSGSDNVLKKMNRKYSVNDFSRAVINLRHLYGKSVAISTDVIVGFPTESENDFLESLSFISSVGFSKIHVFPFSPRAGTNAYALKQIPDELKKERVKQMLLVKENAEKSFNSAFIDNSLKIISEKIYKSNDCFVVSGHSDNYLSVIAESKQCIDNNQLINVFINNVDAANCYGKVII